MIKTMKERLKEAIIGLYVFTFDLLDILRVEKVSRFRHENVPYFSQWESRDLAEQIIRKKISAQKDPLWKNSGAKNPEEYELWSWNVCGMACLKMILSHAKGEVVPLIKLAKKCEKYGGYVKTGNKIDGMYYQPFLKFIEKEFELMGRIVFPMTKKVISDELGKKNYVIASVSPLIRAPKEKLRGKRGGHLILIVGYDNVSKEFFLHNPSGDKKENQENASISFSNFEKFSSHRGIIVLI